MNTTPDNAAPTPASAKPQATPMPKPMAATATRKPRAYESISDASRMGEISRASSILLFSMAATFTALVVWAGMSEVDTVAQAMGKVIPSARVQLMQSLEGGLVRGIHVKQGQAVEAGASLISLSPTQAGGDFQTRRQQTLALQARMARLQAETEGQPLKFAAMLETESPEFVKVERSSFEGRRAEQAMQAVMFDAQVEQRTREVEEARIVIATAEQSLAGAREERLIMEKLVAQGLEPRIELVRLDRAISEADGRLVVRPGGDSACAASHHRSACARSIACKNSSAPRRAKS